MNAYYLSGMNYFITAISTDSGKTLASAIMCEALQADYWKPVQAGLPRDTETVEKLVSNGRSKFHPEQFLLQTPASPHASAKIDGIAISLADFHIPEHDNPCLVIEGAGGCLVPLNEKDLVVDLITKFEAQAVVVSNHYLGSINHTLLTIEALQRRNVSIKGVIFNGDPNVETETIILRRTNLPCLLRINREGAVDRSVVGRYASLLRKELNE